VCASHGGRAPQVKAAAQQRLQALIMPAIAALAALIEHADSDSVRLSAAKDLLDRTGFKPSIAVDFRGQAEQIAQDLGLDADELVAVAEAIVRGQSAR